MNFDKILPLLLRGPLLAPDESGTGGEESNDTGDTSNNSDGKDEGSDDGTGGDASEGKIVFNNQAELDAIISKRINKAVKNAKKEADDNLKKSQMSETEKLKAEKEEADARAEKAIATANRTLIRAEITAIAAKLNIVDAAAAYALLDKDDIDISDNGDVNGVEKALKVLIKEKPYLVNTTNNNQTKPSGDDQNQSGGKPPTGMSMNALIRKAAGR